MATFNWDELLNIANQMATEHNADKLESKGRTAINRAYYAAFNKARVNMRDIDKVVPTRDRSVHTQVIEHYKSSTKYGKIWDDLERIRSFRQQCDYNDESIKNLSIIIIDTINKAKNVCQVLNKK
jgi:hypothetical protein